MKYKVTYSQIVSYKTNNIKESFGLPYIETVYEIDKILDGYEDLGFNSYKDALKRANELKNITNKKYINIQILEDK